MSNEGLWDFCTSCGSAILSEETTTCEVCKKVFCPECTADADLCTACYKELYKET